MKNLGKLILFVCFGVLFAACNNDNLTDSVDINGGGSDVVSNGPKVTRTLSFSVPDMTNAGLDISRAELEEDADEAISFGLQPATRATVAATADEKTIKSLYIMQFDAAGKRLNAQTVPSSDIKTDASGNATVDVTIDDAAGSKIYVFANCAPNGKGDTEAKLKADSVILASAISAANVATNGLPMMGTATWASGATSVSVPMSFLVAKISTTVTNSLTGFTISKVDLYNVPQHIYIDSSAATTPTEHRSFWTTYDAKTTATGELVFYVPENKRGTVSGLTAKTKSWWDAPDKAMSLRISGTISGKSAYYEIFPGANSTTDFNVTRNTVYTINPTVKGANGSADLRVWSGETVANLSASGTANCYMASVPGKLYYFDATKKGNAKNTTGITDGTTALAPKSMAVLWETTSEKYIIRRSKLIGNYVYFSLAGTVGSDVRQGNALIAVRDAASGGNILWSWHIWSTDYNPATSLETYKVHTSVTGVTAPKMMNRNLGAANNAPGDASAFGMLYQWGRKDPFVGSADISGTTFAASTMGQTWTDTDHTKQSTAATGTIAYTIKNPTVFLTQCNTTTYDWLYAEAVANQNNNLWGNPSSVTGSVSVTNLNKNNPGKTIYDPCPVGYKVPPQYTWTNFTTTGNNSSTSTEFNVNGTFNHGWQFYYAGTKSGASTFYPAAGYRYRETGALGGIGTEGNYRSSSTYATGSVNVINLNFTAGYVSPLNGWYRSNAYSVRCVQE